MYRRKSEYTWPLFSVCTAEPKPDVQVYNLEGSIFKWANEGRPLVDPTGNTAKLCHPYSAVWGKLLNKELRSNSPYVA